MSGEVLGSSLAVPRARFYEDHRRNPSSSESLLPKRPVRKRGVQSMMTCVQGPCRDRPCAPALRDRVEICLDLSWMSFERRRYSLGIRSTYSTTTTTFQPLSRSTHTSPHDHLPTIQLLPNQPNCRPQPKTKPPPLPLPPPASASSLRPRPSSPSPSPSSP